ncbi:MAG: ATP-binding protein, partial [Pseudomonadota bacterium]
AGAVIFRQQRKYAQLQLEQTRELEQKVDERTHLLRNEIEDRKRAEKRLRKTQNQLIEAAKLAALGKMSATIAHEVSQPLAALNTTLASARLHADRNQTEALENKLSAAQNMTGRLHRMLKHLKSFARRSAPKAGNVNVNDTIDAALAVLEPKIKAVDVAIARDVDAKLKVFADDLQLQQVLVNVIANAIDATQERETRLVTIKATKASATIILSVHDTGKGINLDHQADPFEPFQTTKVTGEGLGLGLAITREIVERHGGHISLANHPHGGAIVSISLPAARLSSEVEPELA